MIAPAEDPSGDGAGEAPPQELTVEQLTERVNGEHAATHRKDAEAQRLTRESVAHAVETGRLLKTLKDRIGHGGWEAWVERDDTTHFGKSTAAKYMKLADEWPRIEEQYPERVPDLRLWEAFKLAYNKPDTEQDGSEDKNGGDELPRHADLYLKKASRCEVAADEAAERPERLLAVDGIPTMIRAKHQAVRQAMARLEAALEEAEAKLRRED